MSRPTVVAVFSIQSALLTCSTASGYTVEIDQPQMTGGADIPVRDITGQTFTAESDHDLVGLRLMVRANGWGGDYPRGSDAMVRLRSLGSNGIPIETPLAEGLLELDDLSTEEWRWVTVMFDQPYRQTTGQVLCFMVDGLTGGGSEGWNDYGLSWSNPYAGGEQFYLDYFNPFTSDHIQINASIDFTFQTLVDAVAVSADLNGDGFVGIRDLNLVLSFWNRPVPPQLLHPADPSRDGFVGVEDLNIVLSQWNTGTPPVAPANVPEPNSLIFLASFAAPRLCRRSRWRR